MCFTSPELRSASSYGHFTAAKEFRSQCRILHCPKCKRSILQTIHCPKCNRSILQTIHCPKCKRSILQTIHCPKCKRSILQTIHCNVSDFTFLKFWYQPLSPSKATVISHKESQTFSVFRLMAIHFFKCFNVFLSWWNFFGAALVIGRPSLSGVLEPGIKGPRYRAAP